MEAVALNISADQAAFLAEHGIVFDYSRMSDDDLVSLEEELGFVLALKGLDAKYDDNSIGRQARAILDLLVDI